MLSLRSGTYALPFGEIAIAFDETRLRWAGRRLTDLAPVAELKIRGLKTRYLPARGRRTPRRHARPRLGRFLRG